MRIDLVITELDTGGAEKCCADLAIFLSGRGHSVRVIAIGPRAVSPKDSVVRQLEANRIEMHFLGGRSWWALPSVLAKLRRLMKTDRPDVVQSFLWHANLVSAWVVPSLGVPLFGGIRVAEPQATRHAFDRWAAGRSTKTICVSQGVADWCIHSEGIHAGKLLVIPNGVTIHVEGQNIDPETHVVPKTARVLLFVGRLVHQKGIDVLVGRSPTLLRELPDHHLVVIGDGSMRSHLDTLSQNPELIGRVHCLGQRKDVRAWMARAELLLLPTRYEGMPNVILEAMAGGLAVVTTRVEGVGELLGDQREEQSVAKEDWEAFFQLVVRLANSRENRQKLGQANKARAEQEFVLEQQLLQYELLYMNSTTSRTLNQPSRPLN